MTVDAARRSRRRTPVAGRDSEPYIAPATSIAIGEIGQTIFECPSCARPLALGVGRCPGCGTRLVRGVALGKASAFIAIGLAVGLLAGAGAGLAFGLTHAAAAPAAIAAGASSAPGTGSQGSGAGILEVRRDHWTFSFPRPTAPGTTLASALVAPGLMPGWLSPPLPPLPPCLEA